MFKQSVKDLTRHSLIFIGDVLFGTLQQKGISSRNLAGPPAHVEEHSGQVQVSIRHNGRTVV